MQLPETLNVKDHTVDIYLGGPGFGEGVFIVIGKAIAIGIDCCSSFFQRRQRTASFLEDRIRELGSDSPILWALTHYHYDHFHYLSSVLKLISSGIRGTVFPFDYNPADVSYLAEQIIEFPNDPTKVHRAQKEYNDLRNLIKLAPFSHGVSRIQGLHDWIKINLGLPNGEFVPLRLQVLSCSSEVYDTQIGLAVAELRNSGTSVSRQNANRGSYIISCEVGKFYGLFLGDAGTERVEQLAANGLIGKRKINCLKVGHHGSLDATNERLLELIAASDKAPKEQHALIAPYNSAGLPNSETIELLRSFGYSLHISGSPKGDQDTLDRIKAEGGMLTQMEVTEVKAAGSDISSLHLRF